MVSFLNKYYNNTVPNLKLIIIIISIFDSNLWLIESYENWIDGADSMSE
jgi:hypothetical protein